MTGKIGKQQPAPEPGGSLITRDKLQQLYTAMVQCRLLAEHAGKRGELDAMGQEALATGWVIDLREADTVSAAALDGMASLVKGVPLNEIVERLVPGRAVETREQMHAATTAAREHKRKNKGGVVVVFAGVAATRLDCWKKAQKQAVKRNLPIIFVVENNPWIGASRAATSQREVDTKESARRSLLPAITVDGNDVVAVYRVACESLQRVRQGDGPVMVEGQTYHATGKRTSRINRDSLAHMEQYLGAKKLFSLRWKKELQKEFSRKLAAATKVRS